MRQARAIRSTLMLILMSAAIVLAGCTGPGKISLIRASGTSPDFTISYSGAAGWLTGLDAADAQEQARDWARLGLASHLGLDTARLRDATYDTLPVRDPGFDGLAQQDIGPGRSLYDGKGVLHLLVPRDAPHQAATIGLLLDQYRTDAGTDAPLVQVHYYQVNTATDTIDITAGPAEPVNEVRAANGYVTLPVDTAGELARFLARTSYLSRLELRGSELWASGWDWPTSPDARMDLADVSALQRGYTDAESLGAPLPGFSLDPQHVTTAADLLAVIPGLSREMADRIIAHDWAGSPFSSASDLDENIVQPALFGPVSAAAAAALSSLGLPVARAQLWALDAQLRGDPAYSQARFEGGLAGTAVGMTMNYADYVAKTWVSGVGTGIPPEATTGFVPDTTAATVWSECDANPPPSEMGRLWFGENDSAVRSDANQISLGDEPVRLYARSYGPDGNEVQPSYSVGRALVWWDQNYQAIADYDPEYQHLDQIMRWSDAIDWLVSKTSAALPRLPDDQIPSNLTFEAWYHQRHELRERSAIDFVSPPAAASRRGSYPTTTYAESIAHLPSRTFLSCGAGYIEGGISLGDSSAQEGDVDYHPDVPPSVSRAGTDDRASHFNQATGTGDIEEVSLDDSGTVTSYLNRRFSLDNGTATIDVTASGRPVAPFGRLRVWRAGTAPRTLKLSISADPGQISERIGFQGRDLGELDVRDVTGLVTVQWRSGLLDQVRTVLEAIQGKLRARPAAGLPAATGAVLTDAVLYDYRAADGQTLYRMASPGAPWLSVTERAPPAGDGLEFRGGAPNAAGTGPVFFFGKLVRGPDPDGGWLDVTPAGTGHAASVRPASTPPGPGDRPIRVTTPEGATGTAYVRGGHLLVRDDDPVLGLHGLSEGAAMLRDFPSIDAAMGDAAAAGGGLQRAVVLDGDAVALAGDGAVTLLPADGRLAAQVREAVGSGVSPDPLFLTIDGQVLLASEEGLAPLAGSRTVEMDLADALSMTGQPYVNYEAFRSRLAYEDGPVITGALPLDTKVVVGTYLPADSGHIRPDVLVHHGAAWVRVTASSGSATPTPAPTDAAGAAAPGGQILLICPASAASAVGCPQ
jgi:hypothetical protein